MLSCLILHLYACYQNFSFNKQQTDTCTCANSLPPGKNPPMLCVTCSLWSLRVSLSEVILQRNWESPNLRVLLAPEVLDGVSREIKMGNMFLIWYLFGIFFWVEIIMVSKAINC